MKISGFTLVELLAAMAVLVILMAILVNVLNGSTKAFRSGTKNSELNFVARTVMDYIQRDLATAYAFRISGMNVVNMDVIYDKDVEDKPCPYNFPDALSVPRSFDRLMFARMNGSILESGDRDLKVVRYHVKEYDKTNSLGNVYSSYGLMRAFAATDATIGPYLNTGSFPNLTGGGPIIENVTSFAVSAYNADGSDFVFPCTGALPAYVDLVIGLMSDEDLKMMSIFTDNKQKAEFLNKNEQFVATRVNFVNRLGSSLEY